MKRKILAFVLALVLVLSAASCAAKPKTGADSVSSQQEIGADAVLASFIAALNQVDFKKAATYTNDTEGFDLGELEAYENAESGSEEAFARDLIYLVLKNVKLDGTSDYAVDSDKASLTARISNVDINTIAGEVTQAAMTEALADPEKFSDPGYANQYVFEKLGEALAAADAKRVDTEVKVTFVKVESEWKIDVLDDANEDLGKALTGGLDESL
ncbi:MAG: DUF5105 domain-containing protein [Oscillospiraceae bacterium]|jgi:hypothetical protein|nr:DUF5105 domain-containing protein [Oscillospiraceae bacterium]